MRTNIYKQKIVELLKKKHLLTMAEIHKAIPEADYSTVFRNIEQLLTSKEIKKITIDNKSVAYESSQDSHDHFICNDCGEIESIHLNIQKQFKKNLITDITIRGTCDSCANTK